MQSLRRVDRPFGVPELAGGVVPARRYFGQLLTSDRLAHTPTHSGRFGVDDSWRGGRNREVGGCWYGGRIYFW